MNASSFFDALYRRWEGSRRYHVLVWVFLVLVPAILGFVSKPFAVDSNFMSILPDFSADKNLAAADKRFSGAASGAWSVFFGDADFAKAKAGAQALYESIKDDPELESLTFYAGGDSLAELGDFAFRHRYRLIAPSSVEELERGEAEDFAADALREIYSPFSFAALDRLDADPFMLVPRYERFALGLLSSASSLSPREGVLAAEHDGLWYVLVAGRMRGAAMAGSTAFRREPFVPRLAALAEKLKAENPGMELVYSGMPFHAWESSRSAQAEISAISAVASILVLALALFFLRSLVPLAATAFSVIVGSAAALSLTNAAFGSIHLLTLVLGTSLIGNAVDFALLFFAEWKNPFEPRDGPSVTRRTLAQISLGLLTTLVSYVIFAWAPFLMLRQLAVFSMVGLVAAFLTQLFLFGSVPAPRAGSRPLPLGFSKRLLGLYDRLYRSRPVLKVLLVFCLAAALGWGLSLMRTDNDIRSLYSVSPELAASEKKASALLGGFGGGRYFIVRGADSDQALERAEALAALLDAEKKEGRLDSYMALSPLLPSLAAQRRSLAAARAHLAPLAGAQFAALGFPPAAARAFDAALDSQPPPGSLAEEFFSLKAVSGLRQLWIGELGGEFFVALSVGGGAELSALRGIEKLVPGCRYVDKVSDVSSILNRYSLAASVLLALAYLVTIAGLWPLYGLRPALAMLASPLLASAAALAGLGLAGLPCNLFAVIGLVLILGTGVDYSIFYYSGLERPQVPAIGTFLAMATTFISYLALAFCSFPPAKIFGLTLSIGTAVSYLSAPIAARLGGGPGR